MTAQEKRVKKYIDAWFDGKRVQQMLDKALGWSELRNIYQVMAALRLGIKLRIVKGKRV
jgi:hypothetical protein